MKKIPKTTLAILLFIIAFAITSLVPTQIITMDRYILNLMFLWIWVISLVVIFKKNLSEAIAQSSLVVVVIVIACSLALHAGVVYSISSVVQPLRPFDSHGVSFLLRNNFFTRVKPLDVLNQQLLILLLVKTLERYWMTLQQITILFLFWFGAIHIFQIFKADILMWLAFTVGALLLSCIFPYMILRVKNWYAYNYAIHLGVYSVAALAAWLLY